MHIVEYVSMVVLLSHFFKDWQLAYISFKEFYLCQLQINLMLKSCCSTFSWLCLTVFMKSVVQICTYLPKHLQFEVKKAYVLILSNTF